jgi:hypothetical protein
LSAGWFETALAAAPEFARLDHRDGQRVQIRLSDPNFVIHALVNVDGTGMAQVSLMQRAAGPTTAAVARLKLITNAYERFPSRGGGR